MWSINYTIPGIPPSTAEIKWTRDEGIQKRALWIEVCFLQSLSAVFCVPLPLDNSIFPSPTHSRAPLSRGKVSGVESLSRGGTGRHKLTRKSCAKSTPFVLQSSALGTPHIQLIFYVFSQVLKRELHDHKVRTYLYTSETTCIWL